MHLPIRSFLAVACLCGHAPFAWSGPEQRSYENDTTLAVSGELKLEYFDKKTADRTGKIGKDSDFLVDEAVLALNGKFSAFPEVTLILATEKINTSEFEPVFVKELFLTHHFNSNYKLIAGRMVLPFGNFKTATVTDPQTKKIGKAKTDAGLGVKGKNEAARLEWNVVAFADDYRTPGPGADGVTANLSWNATNTWMIGAGVISSQYARTHSPALANIHIGARDGVWKLTGEYIAALDNNGGEKPKALSVDGVVDLTSRIKLGARVQTAVRRFATDGPRLKYNEWALAFKYAPSQYVTMGVEYLAGKQRDGSVEIEKTGKITAQVVLTF